MTAKMEKIVDPIMGFERLLPDRLHRCHGHNPPLRNDLTLCLLSRAGTYAASIARHRTAQRERGLHAVTLWLPDLSDPGYRARLAEECRR